MAICKVHGTLFIAHSKKNMIVLLVMVYIPYLFYRNNYYLFNNGITSHICTYNVQLDFAICNVYTQNDKTHFN